MTTTIRDIAERAGVTHRTVSNVLAGNAKGVRSDARRRAERIREIAEELGYRPNMSAKAIRRGRFNSVGLIASTTVNRSNFPGLLWQGIDEVLAARETQLVLSRLADQRLTDPAFVPQILRELSCDGLLINYTHGFPPRMRELVLEARLPSVWINARQSHDCVYPDDVAAGVIATEHLLQLGHSRIAFVTGVGSAHYSVSDRCRGYSQAMHAARHEPICLGPGFDNGLPREGAAVEDVTWDAMVRRKRFGDFLAAVRPTAVVTYGTMDALTLLFAATRLGLSVPGDLSIVNVSSNADTQVGLAFSTVLVPEYEVGRTAAEMLFQRIETPEQLPGRAIAPAFVRGDTTAALP